jgi:hypothetical protein
MTTENEKVVRDTFEAMHKGRDLTRHHLRGTYVKPQIAALWNQHCRTWQAALQPQPSNTGGDSFQQRVQPWMMACFGPEISSDTVERNHRFIEEALELVQACGCTQSEAHQLVDYVYGRPVGEKHQEVGGVMVTLAALCLAQGLDMQDAGETELARIWTKVEKIRAKQAAKPKHSPLPEHAPKAPQQAPQDGWKALPVRNIEAAFHPCEFQVTVGFKSCRAASEFMAALKAPPQQQEQSVEAVAPIGYIRLQNGKVDWDENCLSATEGGTLFGYEGKDGYTESPVYLESGQRVGSAALYTLLEYCERAEDCQMGTLAIDLVQRLVNEALSTTTPTATASQESAPEAGGEARLVAYRAWLDDERGARWVFTLWPEDEHLEVIWEPLFLAPPTSTAIAATAIRQAAEVAMKMGCAGRTIQDTHREILKLTPAAAEAELEVLMMRVAELRDQESAKGYMNAAYQVSDAAIVRRVLDEKGE